ncbi:hypothetical protein ColTof4_14356 [Colletotrichum tofieldiae]|nr:hypothetical protein ColTof3_14767 [Colletotrichum tofieldiae]GKT81933.1 hypothetical protein ColTof4_14356 [Colletotrichum tofieldiae]
MDNQQQQQQQQQLPSEGGTNDLINNYEHRQWPTQANLEAFANAQANATLITGPQAASTVHHFSQTSLGIDQALHGQGVTYSRKEMNNVRNLHYLRESWPNGVWYPADCAPTSPYPEDLVSSMKSITRYWLQKSPLPLTDLWRHDLDPENEGLIRRAVRGGPSGRFTKSAASNALELVKVELGIHTDEGAPRGRGRPRRPRPLPADAADAAPAAPADAAVDVQEEVSDIETNRRRQVRATPPGANSPFLMDDSASPIAVQDMEYDISPLAPVDDYYDASPLRPVLDEDDMELNSNWLFGDDDVEDEDEVTVQDVMHQLFTSRRARVAPETEHYQAVRLHVLEREYLRVKQRDDGPEALASRSAYISLDSDGDVEEQQQQQASGSHTQSEAEEEEDEGEDEEAEDMPAPKRTRREAEELEYSDEEELAEEVARLMGIAASRVLGKFKASISAEKRGALVRKVQREMKNELLKR